MNERIEKLAEQVDLLGYCTPTKQAGRYVGYINVADIEKFAELIVRECARVAKITEADDGDDYKSGRQWAGIEILKHFNLGVEE